MNMDQERRSETHSESKKLKDVSSNAEAQDQKKEEQVRWKIKEIDPISEPKMGID